MKKVILKNTSVMVLQVSRQLHRIGTGVPQELGLAQLPEHSRPTFHNAGSDEPASNPRT